tara:strand:- start:1217 stop:3190 length:1974 start_codon:yes stop_codon:yes gene_type:complete
MKTLLCSVPDGSIDNTLTPLIPRSEKAYEWLTPWRPVGILRIVSWMEEKGYNADIYDINNLRPSDEELIKNFKKINPTVVGLSATLTHCYPNTKRITKIIRKLFPDAWIVVGGGLTGSANVLLDKTDTDICVIGDGEIPFVKLLDYFKTHRTHNEFDYNELSKIKGLAFIDENNKLKVTGNAAQLTSSEIGYPNYEKLVPGFREYSGNPELVQEFFDIIKNSEEMKKSKVGSKFYYENIENRRGEIETSRGCVARCTFCQRSTKGYRVYASDVLEKHVCELKEKYNVKAINITDENALSNKKQSYEIARIMKKHNLLWACTARVTSVTYEDLKFYRDHNLYSITFGVESGSQKILDIMEKKFKKEDVYQAISYCAKLGIHTHPNAIMLGMPGETRKTILESAEFVASLTYVLDYGWEISSPFLAMAIPGTPLYEYCQQIGVIGKTIDEEEDYLIRVSNHKNTSVLNYVNKTDSSMKEVHYWLYLYHYAAKKEYVNLIFKSDMPFIDKIKKYYKDAIKGSVKSLVESYNDRKNNFKNIISLRKIKWLILLSANFLLTIGCAILPKVILFNLVKIYANIRLYSLTKGNKAKEKSREKNNFFVDDFNKAVKGSKITDERISEEERMIKRSLRTIVATNRNSMKPAITQEDKALQVLAEGQ